MPTGDCSGSRCEHVISMTTYSRYFPHVDEYGPIGFHGNEVEININMHKIHHGDDDKDDDYSIIIVVVIIIMFDYRNSVRSNFTRSK